jgi:hypothetical protein
MQSNNIERKSEPAVYGSGIWLFTNWTTPHPQGTMLQFAVIKLSAKVFSSSCGETENCKNYVFRTQVYIRL